jgi:hypothetical protein
LTNERGRLPTQGIRERMIEDDDRRSHV